jgi:DNA-binding response OmpR family regulator
LAGGGERAGEKKMNKKILITEDEVDLATVLKTYLEAKGYEILTAFDGEKAIEVAQREIPDLILLDVMLPKLDGYTVLRELKGKKETKGIPVIVVTAKEKMKGMFEIEGAEDYLVKPFERGELLEKIEKALK